MNIKEIALKLGEQIYGTKFYAGYPSGNRLIDFAEALVAELAKENDPVAWYDGNKFYANEESASMGCADMANLNPLYLLPPTAEQIEQETAEAIAKHFEQSGIGGEYLAEVIRSGKWKEYK